MSGRSLRKLPIKAHSYYLQRPVVSYFILGIYLAVVSIRLTNSILFMLIQVSVMDFICAMHAVVKSEQLTSKLTTKSAQSNQSGKS